MKKEAAREVYGKKLIELGYKIPQLMVMDADLSNSTKTALFQREFPHRHFNMGIAENNMMLFASGMAITGKVVFVSSFAMFATGRAWEMIRNTIAHDRLNVKIVATHAGISVGEDGGSHQANEDMAIMRAIPNLQIFCPADSVETEKVIEYAAYHEGPMYVRLSREAFPVFMDEKDSFEPGRGKILLEGKDATLISTGVMSFPCLQAGQILKEEGISLRVVHLASVKPLDHDLIAQSAKETGVLFTCEEHSVIGGLGSAVAESVCQTFPVKVHPIGIQDEFGQSGKPEELFKFYGLTAEDIAKKIKKTLGK